MAGPFSNTVPSLYFSNDSDIDGQEFWPITRSLMIGRQNADITICLPALSRRHAEVKAFGAAWQIQDLNSKNGTAVNGTMLSDAPHWLRHGDTIVLGGVVELRFHDPQATPMAPRLGKLQGLWIDKDLQEVWIDAEKLSPPLSNKQLALLEVIAGADGRLVSKETMIELIWPDRSIDTISMDAVDSLIKRLRRRLATVEHKKPVLEVIRSRGVRLRQERERNA